MLADVVGVATGDFHTVLVKQDGSVWSTGVSLDVHSERFVKVIPSGAMAAAAGTGYSIVLKKDGSVWTTRKESEDELPLFDGSTTCRGKFSFVKRITGAKAVAAGGNHSMVLTQEAHIWATGLNNYGQLGDGSTQDSKKFIQLISSGAKTAAVAAGAYHSILLKEDGSVWATGRNYNGQLGDGSKTDRRNFVQVMSNGATNVAAGYRHNIVLKQHGSVWATGWNEYGQLGDGSTTDRTDYMQVVSSGAKAVAAGRGHSLVLKQDGSVWATGYNKYGQLGDASTIDITIFVQVIFDGVKAVSAGAFHSMVLNHDGSVWATGSNKYGQFGDGTTISQKKFVRLRPCDNGAGHNTVIHRWFASICTLLFFHSTTTMYSQQLTSRETL